MLQHGSILVEDDQSLVSALARSAVPVPQPAATLAGALNRVPTVDEVATALFASVRSMECGTATELLMDATIIEAKQRLLDRYLDDRWTWRR
jgi:hypothetical protein